MKPDPISVCLVCREAEWGPSTLLGVISSWEPQSGRGRDRAWGSLHGNEGSAWSEELGRGLRPLLGLGCVV